MGMRSQIYVIAKEKDKYYLTANYYGWNYGERMVSRARGIVEHMKHSFLHFSWFLTTDTAKLRRIMDINWDMKDVAFSTDIVKEVFEDYNDYYKDQGDETFEEYFFSYCFEGQDNTNGQLYIYVDLDVEEDNRSVEICFTENNFDRNGEVLSAEEYITKELSYGEEGFTTWQKYMSDSEYYDDETLEYTQNNINYINDNTIPLSRDKLAAILLGVSEQYQEDTMFELTT